MKLVIAEKASVGMSLAAVLGAKERRDGCLMGNGWIVSWCVGHLLELADVRAYDEKYARWKLADLPILPDEWKFSVSEGKKKQLDILRKLLSDNHVDAVVCATDAGREGELIFRLVYDYCKCRKPVERLWVSSMEDAAIREGFNRLRPGADYDNLYRAALCRAKADYMVGINATRLFSCLYGATLNVGRVQSPTLAMLVQREAEIAAFVSMPFYTTEIDTGTFTASGERLSDRQAAEAIRTACDSKVATVRSVQREKKTAAAPAIYDLTTLQREANRLYGFTAQQTLDYTQSLYEKKLVSYPRTDSRFLTSDMDAGLPALVRAVAAALPFAARLDIPVSTAQVIDDKKVSDHHGIIPTQSMPKADLSSLPAGERDILSLIATRLLTAVGEKHSFETVTAVLDCEGYSFTAKGKTVLHDGWKAVAHAFRAAMKHKPDKEDAEGEESPALPELAGGQAFSPISASVREGKTTPVRRFTEDSLLAAMESAGAEDMSDDAERRGLGTPATRAGVIERLVKGGFIERKKKQLWPTEKGINLIAVLPDSVKSPKLTAEWEHKLKRIERGELNDKAFMTDIAVMMRGLVKEHPAPDKEHAALFTAPPKGDVIGICPRCGEGVIERTKGFFCSSRACRFALWKDNRFFAAKKKTVTKSVAAALLKEGRVFFSDLHSERTGKTYAAVIVMEDTGDQVNFRLDFEKGDKNNGK